MILKEALRQAAYILSQVGIEHSLREARLLLAFTLKKEVGFTYLHPEFSLSQEELKTFEAFLLRRKSYEPISRIMGKREFWSLPFSLNQDTLDPRPDSETLIEAALTLFPKEVPLSLLDLGTGTGCLLLTLLKEFKNAQGLGIDMSLDALKMARENALTLDLTERVRFQKGDWLEGVEGKFDLIISNPPYIKTSDILTLAPEVKNYDPIRALDGGESGLECYEKIIKDLPRVLKPEGFVLFEIGMGQEQDVVFLLKKAGFQILENRPDLAGIIRCLVARFQE